jgi:hypothetical protein
MKPILPQASYPFRLCIEFVRPRTAIYTAALYSN